ncbi:hypothetical protein [Rubripirellula reticaptiva]|nr:hypothetical protein [Rubripirellula reticaptiva]
MLQIDGLETGKDHVVQMMLANETSETLNLENSVATYNLIKVKPTQPTLAAGQSCRVDLVLQPQANFSKHVWEQSIEFRPPRGVRGASATLTVSSKLKGLFSVSPDSVLLIASTLKGESETRFTKVLDVTFSPPVDPKNFRFSGSEIVNLLDIGVTNRGSGGQAEIEVAAELAYIPTEGVHGDLEITDTVTNKVRVVHITMVQRARIRVFPSKLVFRPLANSDRWVASGMLIREQPNADKDDDIATTTTEPANVSDAVFCTASLGERAVKLKTELTEVSSNVQRFRLTIDPAKLDESSNATTKPSVMWDIHWGKDRVSDKSVAIVPSRP